MKKSKLKVALNMSQLPVSEKLQRSINILTAITDNLNVFTNVYPPVATIQAAITQLLDAIKDAADGGKTKTMLMHDREDDLMRIMFDVAHYVESIANGDSSIVHLAALDTKKVPFKNTPEFELVNAKEHGTIKLKVKPRPKTIYRLEYCKDPMDKNSFQVGSFSDKCTFYVKELEIGSKYWFRVVYIDKTGEHIQYDPASIIVI